MIEFIFKIAVIWQFYEHIENQIDARRPRREYHIDMGTGEGYLRWFTGRRDCDL